MTFIDADRRLLAALRDCGREPRVAAAARALSFTGEHGALWLAAGLAGAAVDRERCGAWLRATALVGAAHLASMGLKRVVRRPRPRLPVHEPLVRTAGRHSFPSSHATSAAAAAVAFGAMRPAGRRLAPPLAAAMCVSRLVVGVHYPTDIAAGAVLGALAARLGARWMSGPAPVRAPAGALPRTLLPRASNSPRLRPGGPPRGWIKPARRLRVEHGGGRND